MDDGESERKFDGLVSTRYLFLEKNLLTRVPSLKNMRSLRALLLESNKITRITPGNMLCNVFDPRPLLHAACWWMLACVLCT